MDIEAVVARKLASECDIEAFLNVQKNTPDEFLTVTLTGDGGWIYRTCSLDVDVWGKDENARKQVCELAQRIISAIPSLEDETNLFHPQFENAYREYDADSGRAKYVIQIEVGICE